MGKNIEIEDLSADTQDAYALYLEAQRFEERLRARAIASPTEGNWGAVKAMESAVYDLFGAFGWLARHDTHDRRA